MERAARSLFGLLLLAPGVLLLMLSFVRSWAFPQLLPSDWQLAQWTQVAAGSEDSGLLAVTLRSLAISASVGIAATMLALPTSRAVALAWRGPALLWLAHLPFALSPVVLGTGLLYVFLLLHLAGSTAGVVLAQWIPAYAYAVVLLSTFWNPLVRDLANLAQTLGATPAQVWRRVLLPRARPLLGVCLFQCFLISWYDYAVAVMVGGGRVETLTIRLFQYFGSGDLRLAAACAVLLIAPPLVAGLMQGRLLALRFTAAEDARDA